MPVLDEALIQALYGSAAQEGNWRPALDRFCALLASCEIALCSMDENAELREFETTGRVIDRGSAGGYQTYYGRIDPKQPILAAGGPGFLFNDARHFDDGFVARNRFYQEFSRPLGTRHTLDLFLHNRCGRSTYFAAMRTSGQGAYDGEAETLFRQASMHFQRALALKEKLDTARAAAGVLDRLRFGVVVLDGARRVVLANRAAAQSLRSPSVVQLNRGTLVAVSPLASCRLDALLAEALSGRGGAAKLSGPTRAKQRDWTVWCVPIRDSAAFPDAPAGKVLVVFGDRSSNLPDRHVIAETYGLSEAEARVAIALAQGATLADIAQRHGVKRSTVRSQLLAVLEKLGVHRQAEVVQRIASDAENPLR